MVTGRTYVMTASRYSCCEHCDHLPGDVDPQSGHSFPCSTCSGRPGRLWAAL